MTPTHHLMLATTRNGTVPMKLTSCGKLVQRESYIRTDINLTTETDRVTCGSCRRTEHFKEGLPT